jgi:hypothetical protein
VQPKVAKANSRSGEETRMKSSLGTQWQELGGGDLELIGRVSLGFNLSGLHSL